jgi:hypothetical protein
MSKRLILWVAIVFLAAACEQPVPHAADEKVFFDVAAYLQEQKNYLQVTQPMLLKSVQTGEKEIETQEIAETDWEQELAIFEGADLRKPSLRDFYDWKEQVLPNGNILVQYTKMEDAEAPVEYLHLELSSNRQLRHLEVSFLEENMLFYSKRKASMSINPGSGNISSYKINGVQKLIFGDSLRYAVKAIL